MCHLWNPKLGIVVAFFWTERAFQRPFVFSLFASHFGAAEAFHFQRFQSDNSIDGPM